MTGLLASVVVMLLLIAGLVVRGHLIGTGMTPQQQDDAELHPRWVDQHDYG